MPAKRKYNVQDIEKAIEQIKNGTSIHAAAKIFNIPRPTLQHRIHNRAKKSTMGPAPVLTASEETDLVTWIFENYERGFPRRKHEVRGVVKEFLDSNPRKNMFVDMPGDRWYNGFLKRHPDVSIRTPEAVTNSSACVSEHNIKGWFKQIQDYFSSKNLNDDVLKDPTRIFNGDESGFLLCPKGGAVLAPKGASNVYETDKGRAKESVTVMFTFSADGIVIPPMIVFHYKRIPKEIMDSIPEGIAYTKTDSGWMTSETFIYYIQDVLYPALVSKNITFPVVLYVDGHKTHLTYALSKLCAQLKIILICLYPNATRILQPADVSIFRPLKLGWTKEVQIWRSTNLDEQFSKKYFAPMLKKVIDKYVKRDTIVNGFRTCGLYPFNENAIDYSKCLANSTRTSKDIEQEECNLIAETTSNISLTEFIEIVGHNKLKELDEIEQSNSTKSEDFLLLYKIYERLKVNWTGNIGTPTNNRDVQVTPDNGALNLGNINGPYSDLSKLEVGQQVLIFETEEVDSFTPDMSQADTEIFNQGDIPMVSIENEIHENHSIQSFLKVIKTPARKGVKNTERTSFIITSTPYQNAIKTKMDEKAKIQQQKLEKQNVRLEKKMLKEKAKENRLKIKLSLPKKRPLTNRNPKIVSDKAKGKCTRINPKLQKDIIKDKENEIAPKTYGSKILQESHVRNLIIDFHGPDEDAENPIYKKIVTGLCFTCVRNISVTEHGIACFICYKAYHIKCASKVCNDFNYFKCANNNFCNS